MAIEIGSAKFVRLRAMPKFVARLVWLRSEPFSLIYGENVDKLKLFYAFIYFDNVLHFIILQKKKIKCYYINT